jgi:hypothetical protein
MGLPEPTWRLHAETMPVRLAYLYILVRVASCSVVAESYNALMITVCVFLLLQNGMMHQLGVPPSLAYGVPRTAPRHTWLAALSSLRLADVALLAPVYQPVEQACFSFP